jgi:hypothetical protein
VEVGEYLGELALVAGGLVVEGSEGERVGDVRPAAVAGRAAG